MRELTDKENEILIKLWDNFNPESTQPSGVIVEAFLFGVGAGIALEKYRIVGDNK